MKQNRFRTLWSAALGLALLASAVPFPASAQMGSGRGNPPQSAPPNRNDAVSPTDPAQGFNSFETWYAMMSSSAAHWDEPTDGQKHPQVYMTSGHDLSYATRGKVPKGRERVNLTISAVVDRAARFEIIKNRIYYRPFQSNTIAGASGSSQISSFDGYYPSGVTVNGKEWHNLRKPLELDFTPDLDALNGLSMNCGDISFICRYGDESGNVSYSSRLVLEIRNKGAGPSPAEIVLNTTALPNRDVKDPDEFEHDPFILRAVVDDEATFIFGKGIIRFVPGKGKEPTNVSVDGHSWDNLNKPFELRKRPANPEIVEMKGRDTAELTRLPSGTYSRRPGDEDEFKLVIKDKYSYPSADLYEIRIDSRRVQPVKTLYSTAMVPNSKKKNPADYEEGRFVLEGNFFWPTTFVFEGNEVRCVQTSKYPTEVKVDGKPWTDRTKPFVLDASPLGMAHPDILEMEGFKVRMSHVNENRLEVSFDEGVSSTGVFCRVVLASKKESPGNAAASQGK